METISKNDILLHMAELETLRQGHVETFDDMAQLVLFGIAEEDQGPLIDDTLKAATYRLSTGWSIHQVFVAAFLAGCDIGRELERMLNRGDVG